MHFLSLVSVVSLHLAFGSAWSIRRESVKRAGKTDATLYAYGKSTSGWPISYGTNDGMLSLKSTTLAIMSTVADLSTTIGNLYIAINSTDTNAGLLPVMWDMYVQNAHTYLIHSKLPPSPVSTQLIVLGSASITEQDWVANATLFNGTSLGSLYIMPEDFQAVGVSSFATIGEINGTVSGFALLTSQLVYKDNSGLESKFWAQQSSTDGIYALMWDSPGDMQDDSFPVTVKAKENA